MPRSRSGLDLRPKSPWELGAELARARRPIPQLTDLQFEWGFDAFDVCPLTLGNLEITDGFFDLHSHLSTERKIALRAARLLGERQDGKRISHRPGVRIRSSRRIAAVLELAVRALRVRRLRPPTLHDRLRFHAGASTVLRPHRHRASRVPLPERLLAP